MAVETETGELTSRHIVEEIDRGLSVRIENLTDESDTVPRLVILSDNPEHMPSQQYMSIKKRVAESLGMTAVVETTEGTDLMQARIAEHNEDSNTHGLIVQLPLVKPEVTDDLLASIESDKDVDGLGPLAKHTPATPLAVLALLDGYGVEYLDERVSIIGRGKLVGEPLYQMLTQRGARAVQAFDKDSDPEDVQQALDSSSIVISAVGKPDLLTPESFAKIEMPRVLIDAGTAEQDGVVKGDVSDALREVALGNGWAITPKRGGIGPLTVRALLSNTVAAAERVA